MPEPTASPAGVSRRDFVKTTAAVSTAALVANLGISTAHAQGSDRIKVGLIGNGGRGGGAIGDCLQNNEGTTLWAVGDLFPERLGKVEGWKNRFKDKCDLTAERVFSGFDAYQKVIASGVDMVILATPPGFRPIHFKAAIEAGKHVFFEKPVATCPTGVRMVIEAAKLAEQKKLGVVTGTQRRHEARYVETLAKIHEGAIGEVTGGSFFWNGGPPHAGGLARGTMSEIEYQCRNWYHFPWICGDHIVEQHVHNLDIMHWVMKDTPPIECVGVGGRTVRTNLERNGIVFDNFALEYKYPNGARMLGMSRQWDRCPGRVDEWAIGTKGQTNCAGWIKGETNWDHGRDGKLKYPLGPYQQEHVHLIKSIREGKPLNEAKRVAESTLLAIMGRMAAYTGQIVKWDFALNKSKLNLLPDFSQFGDMPAPKVSIPGRDALI